MHSLKRLVRVRLIADFSRFAQNVDRDITISKWLRNQLPKKEIGNLLPVSESGDAQSGDMRENFGGTDPLVANTLDLLGEKYLNSKKFDDAITKLQESLYIHTENDRESEDRVRTMILLTKALKLAGRDVESDSLMETVRLYLGRLPSTSRLHKMVEELQSP